MKNRKRPVTRREKNRYLELKGRSRHRERNKPAEKNVPS